MSAEPNSLEPRIRRLERRCRRAELACLGLFACATGACLTAARGTPPREVRAERFVLESARGDVRGSWECQAEGTRLSLTDGENARLWVALENGASWLHLQSGAEPIGVATLWAQGAEAGVSVVSESFDSTEEARMRAFSGGGEIVLEQQDEDSEAATRPFEGRIEKGAGSICVRDADGNTVYGGP